MAGKTSITRMIETGRLKVNEAYSFSKATAVSGESTAKSIGRWGVVAPLVGREGEGCVEILSGADRLEAAVSCGLEEVPVTLLDGFEEVDLWDYLLEERLKGGLPGCVELGDYLVKRMGATGESLELVARAVGEPLGLAPRARSFDPHLWVAGLPEEKREYFAAGLVSEEAASFLMRIPGCEAAGVLDFLAPYRLGFNKFRQYARWLLESAWRQGEDFGQWLEASGLPAEDVARDQLGGRIKALRFPDLEGLEREFRQDVAGAGLPEKLKITHPKGFEGGFLTFELEVDGIDGAKRSVRELADFVEGEGFARFGKYFPDG